MHAMLPFSNNGIQQHKAQHLTEQHTKNTGQQHIETECNIDDSNLLDRSNRLLR